MSENSAAPLRKMIGWPLSNLLLMPVHVAEALSLINVFGVLGIALGSSWALFRTRRTILLIQSAGALAFMLHFLLLGAATGAAMCGVGMLQGLAAASGRPRILVLVYLASVLIIFCSIFWTWSGLPSICAVAGSAFATFGRLRHEPQAMRWSFLCCTLAWIGHNLVMQSPFGLVSDGLSLLGIVLGLTRSRGIALRSAPRFIVVAS
jgi:hypothetical protein